MPKSTGLILVTGKIDDFESGAKYENEFLKTLSPFTIEILDSKTMSIRDRYFLAIYIELDKAHENAILDDLNQTAAVLNLDLAVDFQSKNSKSTSDKHEYR